MSITPQGRKIAIIGASGTLGRPLVAALLASPAGHSVTAVQRADATSSFPAGVRVARGDLLSEAFLASAFAGQDAVVLMPPLARILTAQEPAVRAAAAAGVRYVFPAESGPDPFAAGLVRDNALLQAKKRVRDLIEETFGASGGGGGWVSVAVGPWVEYAVGMGLWGVDARARTATVWRGAEGRVCSATAGHAGRALAAVLSLPEPDLAALRNAAVYAPSLCFTQRELLSAAQRVTAGHGDGTSNWTVEERDVADVLRDCDEALARGDEAAAHARFFVTHAMEGSGADFEHKIDRALAGKLQALGLGGETLEEAIRETLA
ncbi:hypothetical protein V2A60_007204 [Cordyceps javanica]|uniref:Oxidoreductase CipA-like n=1 Tax=Cordyceps javanica TaxID=43265 RepID=A0A545VR73_9HYPO|nr:oxidoreductase CipA-like [Cordyceps javanica]TQW04241.1 oxidoreductase CipA-like [Cordyceps javanica]